MVCREQEPDRGLRILGPRAGTYHHQVSTPAKMSIRYVVISPVRDEEAHLALMMDSMLSQTICPLRCLKRMTQKPHLLSGIGLLCGFIKGYVRRIPRVEDKDLIRYFSRQQMNRLLGRPILWS